MRMKPIVVHVNRETSQFFFSTDHCQETTEKWVPITAYYSTKDEIRVNFSELTEIPNPNQNLQG